MINYLNKYLKYKTKYLQKAGNLFENLYNDLIQYCIDFNKKGAQVFNIFGEGQNDIIHIKGGSSIKFHLIENKIDSKNITSDIDALLILGEDSNKEDILNNILNDLKKKFDKYQWTLKFSNGLYNICLNDFCIFDITVFQNDMEYDESNMFAYAVNKLGYDNVDKYIEHIRSLDPDNPNNLKEMTFTSLQFEYYSTLKGIINQNYYLSSIETWKNQLEEFQQLLPNVKNLNDYNVLSNIITKLKRQVSNEYILKLNDKLRRYQKKLELIKKILKIQ